ncbi:MAG: hypoxanthine phosphoribosyltransferase [Chloroflexi bacterium]|nr:hypoxanthine phosphoribosyltransferase [Chloroflexota bacterium]
MYQLDVLLSPEEIRAVVERLGREVQRDYQGKPLLLLGVLKGCFVFMADLVRSLDMPLETEFVKLSSYGRGRMQSSGRVKVVQGLRISLRNRDVLIVEDIVDTGITLDLLLDYVRRKNPASVKVCALFDKPACHRVHVPIDYLGFSIPNEFVVGYGLDYDEKYRQLPGLCRLRETPEGVKAQS